MARCDHDPRPAHEEVGAQPREIGTTDAQQLVAYRDYYTTRRTRWGSQDRGDDAGARASYGMRKEGCHGDTWCVLRADHKDEVEIKS